MTAYEVSNKTSGFSFGVFEADSPEAAINLVCIDAGYKSAVDMQAQTCNPFDLIAAEITSARALALSKSSAEVMEAMQAAGIEGNQDWDDETTTYTLHDGSQVIVSGRDVSEVVK